jgi:HEAT repeat protein
MITFFCPSCWSQVDQAVTVCPHCGVDIQNVLDQRDYVAKLIAALTHPEASTPIRAAWILGRLRASAAVGPLLTLLEGDADVFIKMAAVEALGQIGDASPRPLLAELAERGPALLRNKAAQALHLLDSARREE